MRRQLVPAFLMTVVLTLLTGVAYPLAVTALAQLGFKHQANGSLVSQQGRVVGSALIGQGFTDPKYFQPRPSAAGKDGYDGSASGASNLGPTNPALISAVSDRVAAYRKLNGLGPDEQVPIDAVTASASGLDPGISVANADIQARRVAEVRGLPTTDVLALVRRHTQDRQLGVLGEKVVNVLELNLDLDRRQG
ncbi:MAG TPA: potassium-transporting ATPase subunit KdpC [Acidimicrobiales bacterium]|nr:potassium-transporting ATPase subunit KdpC [Acidimicrobiales bacterium]